MELILTAPEGDTRRRYALGNGETVIGRRPDCDIVLDAPSIPERHARLFALDGYVVIRALDSHWPVYVNGEPIDRRPLAHGDEIELGHYRLRCDMQPGDRETGNEAAGPPAITDLT
ncbi:MAG TPA: FHA domain-containing protein, partial [Arenicellales bacterium]|nr:FHA domain-containing protein [Arenicellales bacterium]